MSHEWHEHDEGLTGPQREIEQSLGRLRPARGGLSRDVSMYRAGLAHGRRQCRRWNLAMVAVVLVAGSAATLAISRSIAPRVVERIVYRDAPAAGRDSMSLRPLLAAISQPGKAWGWPAASAGYVRMCQEVVDKGIDALPPAPVHNAAEDLSDIWPPALGAAGRHDSFYGGVKSPRTMLQGGQS
jgi:hypothetical protein